MQLQVSVFFSVKEAIILILAFALAILWLHLVSVTIIKCNNFWQFPAENNGIIKLYKASTI